MAIVNLKSIPDDVLKFVLKVQGEIKSDKCISQYSLEKTFYHIVREYKKIKEK